MTSIAESILKAIGGTPVVRLRKVVPANAADVLVKLESVNPTGSYKDRMALAMIEGAEARGVLRPGMRVVEFTGGSTGSSLAMVCAAKGYRFVVLSSDAFAREKLLTMEALGADLRIVPSDGGKVTPALFERFKRRSHTSRANLTPSGPISSTTRMPFDGYMDIGRELLEQTGGRLDAYCGAVGTGGMLRGVAPSSTGRRQPRKIVALEPLSSPALTQGSGGAHRVEGIGTGACRRTWPMTVRRGARCG